MNPIAAVGALGRISESSPRDVDLYLGTCFAFKHPQCFLAATHCISDVDLSADQVAVGFRPFTEGHEVDAIYRHPEADLCILRLKDDPPPSVEVFQGIDDRYGLGEEFGVLGMPESLLDPGYTPRMFRGYFQRYFHHISHKGFRYFAGEMSIPNPYGLSGGPLFTLTADRRVLGVAVDQFQSESTSTDAIRDVTTYGIALMLDRVQDWVESHIPNDAR